MGSSESSAAIDADGRLNIGAEGCSSIDAAGVLHMAMALPISAFEYLAVCTGAKYSRIASSFASGSSTAT